MRVTWRIAKTEIDMLLYSPVSWLAFAVFSWQTGLECTTAIRRAIGSALWHRVVTDGITNDLISNIFWGLKDNLYLYVPLLTMGLMSREFSSGSVKLMYSSPVRAGNIVLGKYLGICLFGGMIIAVLLVYGTIGAGLIPGFQWRWYLTAVFGAYLLFCTYASIGLLLSSLTSYQIVAAMCTLAVLAGLHYAGQLWQGKPVLGDIAHFLSVKERFDTFRNGLIDSSNVDYFIALIIFFIGLTIFIMEARRRIRPLGQSIIRMGGILAGCILIGLISSRPAWTGYYDATADRRNTVDTEVQALLSGMDGQLTIHAYVNLLDQSFVLGLPSDKYFAQGLFGKYQRFLRREIRFDYTYYYDSVSNNGLFDAYPALTAREVARKQVEGAGIDFATVLSPLEMEAVPDLGAEGKSFVRVLEYEGKKTFLRIFADMIVDPMQDEIAAALKRLASKPVKVGWIGGQGEHDEWSDADYGPAFTEKKQRDALINQGFDFVDMSPDSTGIDTSVSIIVVAGPKSPLLAGQLERLKGYMQRGTNMLILGEGGSGGILDPLTASLGVRLMTDGLHQQHAGYPPDFIFGTLADSGLDYSPIGRAMLASGHKFALLGATGVRYEVSPGVVIRPMLVARGARMGADSAATVPLAVQVVRTVGGKEQRIMVAGDAGFLTTAVTSQPEGRMNMDLGDEIFHWLSNGEYPFETLLNKDLMARKLNKDTVIRAGIRGYDWVRLLSLLLVPGIFLISGIGLMLKRKSK